MARLQFALFFSCLLALVHAQLKCYDCDPTSAGRCIEPKSTNAKTTVCQDAPKSSTGLKKQISDINKLDIEPRFKNDSDLIYECFTLYFESDDETRTGVYRGCHDKSADILSSCELLKEEVKGGNITECTSCSDLECNVDEVGGAANLSISLAAIITSVILSFKILF